MNFEEHLNLSCSINQTHLTFSNDLKANNFKLATLQDEDTGMICSMELNEFSERKMIFTFPHNLRMKISDGKSIEFDWMNGKIIDESKRVFFPNGFVLIYDNDGKIYFT